MALRAAYVFETKCTSCGHEGAYVGLHDVKCPNPKCLHFDSEMYSSSGGLWPDHYTAREFRQKFPELFDALEVTWTDEEIDEMGKVDFSAAELDNGWVWAGSHGDRWSMYWDPKNKEWLDGDELSDEQRRQAGY